MVLAQLKMFVMGEVLSYGVSSVQIKQKGQKILTSESFCYLYVKRGAYAFENHSSVVENNSESAGKE